MKFLNGKDFHPSNFKNQERLWRAEEKKKAEEKRTKELMIERQKEWQKEQLQKVAIEAKHAYARLYLCISTPVLTFSPLFPH